MLVLTFRILGMIPNSLTSTSAVVLGKYKYCANCALFEYDTSFDLFATWTV